MLPISINKFSTGPNFFRFSWYMIWENDKQEIKFMFLTKYKDKKKATLYIEFGVNVTKNPIDSFFSLYVLQIIKYHIPVKYSKVPAKIASPISNLYE